MSKKHTLNSADVPSAAWRILLRRMLPNSRRTRMTWAICIAVIASGAAASHDSFLSGDQPSAYLGCDEICATFCPVDSKEYCKGIGCGTKGASCNTNEKCVMYPYEFAATLKCGAKGRDIDIGIIHPN